MNPPHSTTQWIEYHGETPFNPHVYFLALVVENFQVPSFNGTMKAREISDNGRGYDLFNQSGRRIGAIEWRCSPSQGRATHFAVHSSSEQDHLSHSLLKKMLSVLGGREE